MRRHVIDLLLLVAVVAVLVTGLLLGAGRSSGGEGEAFQGTDSAASAVVASQGHEPWFAPIFSPGSAEVESGLFAMQAAIGAGVLGYCLGALRGRRTASGVRAGSASDGSGAGSTTAVVADARRADDGD